MTDEKAQEWREQIGVAAMLATRCTHEGDDPGHGGDGSRGWAGGV